MEPDERQELVDLLEPTRTAVVVIDYQNDFVSEGGALHRAGLHSPGLAGIAPDLGRLVGSAREAGALVVLVRCHYDRDRYLSPAFLRQARRRFHGLYVDVPVCESGTWGAEFVPGFEPQDGDVVVTKHRFSAFAGTDLDQVLRNRGVTTLVVGGVVTHVCVESTVRDAAFLDYSCVVPRETTAGWQPDWHQTSLQVMDWGFGRVVGLQDVVGAWAGEAAQRPAEGMRV